MRFVCCNHFLCLKLLVYLILLSYLVHFIFLNPHLYHRLGVYSMWSDNNVSLIKIHFQFNQVLDILFYLSFNPYSHISFFSGLKSVSCLLFQFQCAKCDTVALHLCPVCKTELTNLVGPPWVNKSYMNKMNE